MVVQHNLTAMNSNRMLGVTTSQQAKSAEKLSSGYKINRAADDAAGLSISEKMRKQIRGLTQASTNAQDGISAVQTAEGALTEVHDMLQRMNELAVKSSNGTNSESDRDAIQAEIDQLTTEIDRVSETTKFNETYLLKGDRSLANEHSFSYKTFKKAQNSAATFNEDAGTGATINFKKGTNTTEKQQDDVNDLLKSLRDQGVTVNYTSSFAKGAGAQTNTYTLALNGAAADKYTVTATGNAGEFDIKDSLGHTLMTLTATGMTEPQLQEGDADQTQTAKLIATSITAEEVTAATAKYYDKEGNVISENALNKYFDATTTQAGTTVSNRSDAPDLYDAVGNKLTGTRLTTDAKANVAGLNDLTHSLSVSLHVGADATSNNQITMNIASMSAKGLGVNGIKVDGADDSNALSAIETIKEAISKVSSQRSDLGAVQNRLEHTINNLDNVVENTTSAESAIRDTDMATEMVKYSNNNILAQAGTSMLAQANQSNQSVLSLLG